MLVLQDPEWLQIWRKCWYAHRQVDEQPSKSCKKIGDKSAVAMLKKHESYYPFSLRDGTFLRGFSGWTVV